MALEKFKWNNGSDSAPIVLNSQQIAALVAAGNNENLETEIGGYITTQTRKIQKFLKYSLEHQFENLHVVVDEELADVFTIAVNNPTIKEGTSTPIALSGDAVINGLTQEYIRWNIEFTNISITYGDISEEIIQSRIKIENGQLVVEDPEENANWRADIKLTAYPFYEEGEVDNMESKSNTLILSVVAKAISGFTASCEDEIAANTEIQITTTPIPSDTTKLKGSSYVFSTNDTDKVYVSGDYARTLDTIGPATITVGLCLFGGNIPSYFTDVTFNQLKLKPTAFIIDQRALNGLTDPASMVSGNFKVESNGALTLLSENGATGSATDNTITWIREHSHLYVGKYNTSALGEAPMKLKQLSDTDRTKFADGTDASAYIQNANVVNNISYDVWLKFGSNIYYKSEAYIPDNAEVADDDYVLITIAKELPEGANAAEWEVFSQYKLIGVYEAFQNTNNGFHSLSGKRPVDGISQPDAKSRARARGTGFKLVDYEVHKIMALLFYGYYSTLNSQAQCGFGTETGVNNTYYSKITGLTNSLGMTDTTAQDNNITRDGQTINTNGNGAASPNTNQIQAGTGADIKSNNFWGLENWWGDVSEWMDDMTVMQARRPSNVTTANPSIYLDDFINEYLGANPSQSGFKVTVNGVDTLITPTNISAAAGLYAEDDRFVSIKDIDDNTIRIIKSNTKLESGYIGKMVFGQHCDTFPKALGGSGVTMFCDRSYVGSPGHIARRSSNATNDFGGVGFLSLDLATSYAYARVGSRLLYEGNSNRIQIVGDDESF